MFLNKYFTGFGNLDLCSVWCPFVVCYQSVKYHKASLIQDYLWVCTLFVGGVTKLLIADTVFIPGNSLYQLNHITVNVPTCIMSMHFNGNLWLITVCSKTVVITPGGWRWVWAYRVYWRLCVYIFVPIRKIWHSRGERRRAGWGEKLRLWLCNMIAKENIRHSRLLNPG